MSKQVMIVFGLVLLLNGCVIPNPTPLVGERFPISLQQCIDGDTARFESIGRVRFLYIDTPEVYPEMEPFGQEAADFTCQLLENANTIFIEYDGAREDQYGRTLGWIWVDDVLLQEVITQAGYVDYFFEYENVKYKQRIIKAYNEAKKNKVGLFK